jgi:DNA-directed RNA polymerase subunit RPC12/RpoP
MAWNDLYIVICPHCSSRIGYKNKIEWILHTPFHFFNKRRTKCERCGTKFYAKLIRIKKVDKWK